MCRKSIVYLHFTLLHFIAPQSKTFDSRAAVARQDESSEVAHISCSGQQDIALRNNRQYYTVCLLNRPGDTNKITIQQDNPTSLQQESNTGSKNNRSVQPILSKENLRGKVDYWSLSLSVFCYATLEMVKVS